MEPLYPAAVTILALLVYLLATMNCGRNRAKHKIEAPAVTGNETYERAYRVQMNTLEHMACFLPCATEGSSSIATPAMASSRVAAS